MCDEMTCSEMKRIMAEAAGTAGANPVKTVASSDGDTAPAPARNAQPEAGERGESGHHHHHDHSHHHHEHHHHEENEETASNPDREKIYLNYLHEHNEEHTEELTQLIQAMDAKGRGDVSELIAKAQKYFQKGNELLHEAIHRYDAH